MTKPLPPGWRRIRLGEVLEQVNRFEQVKPGCEYRLLGVKWYANGCHLHTEILGHALKTKILSTVRADDITYNKMWTSKGAFGVVQPEQDGFVATSEYPLFISRDSALSPAFLSYVFRQRKFWVAARAPCKGTTQRARLHPSDFLRLGIDLPPRSEQERIIAVLRAVDEAIKANEEVIARACDFKKALAHELLTRGLLGRHTHFKDSPIGRIPVEWEVKRLGELLLRIEAGKSPKCEDCPAEPDEWGVLKVSAVSSGYYLPQENKMLPSEIIPIAHLEVRAGDVLVVRANGAAELVGRSVYVEQTRPKLMLSDKTLRLIPDNQKVDGRLIPLLLASGTSRAQIEALWGGSSGQKNISQEALRAVMLAVPPLHEQQQIAQLFETLNRLEEPTQETIQHSLDIRRLLIDLLFSGHVGGNRGNR